MPYFSRSVMSLKRKITNFLLLISFWIILFFALGEITIRIIYPKLANYNLEMWRYSKDLKRPLNKHNLPFHHQPNRAGNYYGVEIKTNSMGFRDEEIQEKKSKNDNRILFLGDSFTLGWGVPFAETFSDRLEQKLQSHSGDYEVINLGISNYNSIMEYELFKWKGLKLDPDMVVLMYFINDAEPVPKYSKFSYSIFGKSYFVAFIMERIQRINFLMHKNEDWHAYYAKLYENNNPALQANKDALNQLIRLCKQKNIQLLIVNIPELHKTHPYPFNRATQFIRNIAEQNNVAFLDLLPYVQDYDEEKLWVSYEDTHANGFANGIFAEAIYQKFLSLNVL